MTEVYRRLGTVGFYMFDYVDHLDAFTNSCIKYDRSRSVNHMTRKM